jgi:GDP-L-fucose synthase
METASEIVLVTGGHGLVGKHLQEFATPNFIFLSRRDGDLTNEYETFEIFKKYKPKIVIHLAAKVGGLYDNMKYNFEYYTQNSRMNINVIEACKRYKVERLINILSTCIFPDKAPSPLSSLDILNGPPHNSNRGYAYAKRGLYIGSSFLDCQVINLIPTNLYGEHDTFNDTSSHVIPALIYKLVRDGKVSLLGNGEAKRQFLYASDFAHIIMNFVHLDIKEKQTSVIVSPNEDSEISINDLANTLERLYCKSAQNFTTTSDSNGQLTKTTSDTELLKYIKDFTFTPLESGLASVLAHYKPITNEE